MFVSAPISPRIWTILGNPCQTAIRMAVSSCYQKNIKFLPIFSKPSSTFFDNYLINSINLGAALAQLLHCLDVPVAGGNMKGRFKILKRENKGLKFIKNLKTLQKTIKVPC